MLFNSFHFFFFFLVFWPVYLLLKGTPRRVFTLIASYYFYMCWNVKFISLIWAITIIDYIAGLMIERARSQSSRRLYLIISLASNLGLLAFFKYFNFLSITSFKLLHLSGIAVNDPPLILSIILPIGLSFHTFQAMSYTIEVYKGRFPAERSFLNYALYVAFFPQMVAGPIERPGHLLPQFREDHKFSWDNLRIGGKQALWGLFKKMVIADGFAGFVNLVYAHPERYHGTTIVAATILFSIQIYCDFSGYSDIAIGLARILGFELCTNFRRPYFARSIGEFWHRWHISLSTWFRDYVYIPLGGSRVSRSRFYFNLMVTFVLSGLWHGASWSFVLWGAYHGTLLVLSQATQPLRAWMRRLSGLEKAPVLLAILQTCITYGTVTFGWILFRASQTQQMIAVFHNLFTPGHLDSLLFNIAGIQRADLPVLLFFVIAMFTVEWLIEHPEYRPSIWANRGVRLACYYCCIFAVIFYGVFGHVDFIYFQF